MRKNSVLLILAGIVLAASLLSLYTYFPARVFVPLFLLGLAVIFFDELKSFKKWAFAIVVSDYIRGAPILVLFYTKYPPRERQLDLKKGLDFNMGKYRISPISKNLNIEGRSLFIVKSYETDNISKELYNLSVRHVIMNPYDNKELLTLLEAVKR